MRFARTFRETEILDFMGLRYRTPRWGRTLAPSAALITVETSEAIHLAANRVLEVASTEAVEGMVVRDIGDRMPPRAELVDNSKMERNTMTQNISILVQTGWKSVGRVSVLI